MRNFVLSVLKNVYNKASRVALDRQGLQLFTPKIVYRKMKKLCQSPRHLGEILLLIVLVAHVDLFE